MITLPSWLSSLTRAQNLVTSSDTWFSESVCPSQTSETQRPEIAFIKTLIIMKTP